LFEYILQLKGIASVLQFGENFGKSFPPHYHHLAPNAVFMQTMLWYLVKISAVGIIKQPGCLGILTIHFHYNLMQKGTQLFDLTNSVWPFRSRDFSFLVVSVSRHFGQNMKSCRNLICSIF